VTVAQKQALAVKVPSSAASVVKSNSALVSLPTTANLSAKMACVVAMLHARVQSSVTAVEKTTGVVVMQKLVVQDARKTMALATVASLGAT